MQSRAMELHIGFKPLKISVKESTRPEGTGQQQLTSATSQRGAVL